MGQYSTVPITDKSVDPGPPYADAAWFNRVDDGVERAHNELNGHETRIETLENTVPEGDLVTSVDGLTGAVDLSEIYLPLSAHTLSTYEGLGLQATDEKGLANGYASLGPDGLVPTSQLPAAAGGATVDSVDGRTGAVSLGDLYVNETDHTKAAHDMMGIDAATLDGIDSTGFAPASHIGTRDGHPVVTDTLDGFMLGSDKAKLDSMDPTARADVVVSDTAPADPDSREGIFWYPPATDKLYLNVGSVGTPAWRQVDAAMTFAFSKSGTLDVGAIPLRWRPQQNITIVGFAIAINTAITSGTLQVALDHAPAASPTAFTALHPTSTGRPQITAAGVYGVDGAAPASPDIPAGDFLRARIAVAPTGGADLTVFVLYHVRP